MARKINNIAASVRARLFEISKREEQDFHFILTRYANERLLYRLAKSDYSDRFVLKGAVLLMTWFEGPIRGTRDVDLLGQGDSNPEVVLEIFKEIFALEAQDGIKFAAEDAKINRIRENTDYGGLRVKTIAYVDGARIPVSVDIGFGDAMHPEPQILELPPLLGDMPTASMRGYARETVIAEKFEAMVTLGLYNTRIKDYYDIWLLSHSFDFEQEQLSAAIAATFTRRRTSVPNEIPDGLSDAFAKDDAKQQLWDDFIKDLPVQPGSLQDVVKIIAEFLMPASIIAYNKGSAVD